MGLRVLTAFGMLSLGVFLWRFKGLFVFWGLGFGGCKGFGL